MTQPVHDDWRAGGFGLYLHWPFCAAKCPYCDFNSHVSDRIDERRWERAYLSEIDRIGSQLGPRVLNTLYFGGGTPSLMSPELVGRVIEAVRATFPIANDLEITLEANPGSVEAGRFRGYRDSGVDRVSLGVQALDDDSLRRLGRIHSAGEAIQALEIANETFDRVGFDLIYAREGQTLAQWRAELTRALALAQGHMSLYQLTIEPGTAFARREAAGGLRDLPDADTAAEFYDLTQELCDAAGLPAYEISNHAAKGQESRHNLVYWRYGDYAGIGPGAHGRLSCGSARLATQTLTEPEQWLRQVELSGHGETDRTALAPTDQAVEYLLLGLRICEGIDLKRFAGLAGETLPDSRIDPLTEIGVLDRDGASLRATRIGRRVLNSVIAALLAD